MKVRDLKKALQNVDDNLEVILRVQHTIEVKGKGGSVTEEDCSAIGGVTGAVVDAGCTESDAFVIDGNEDELEADDSGETDDDNDEDDEDESDDEDEEGEDG